MSEHNSSADEQEPQNEIAPGTHEHDSARTADPLIQGARERFGAFYLVYVGIFVFLFAYLISVSASEAILDAYFRDRVEQALVTEGSGRPVERAVKSRLDQAVQNSAWVRWGGLQVTTLVLAKDGASWLYLDGNSPPASETQPTHPNESLAYLPVTARVTVTLPHNSLASNAILIIYASILLFVIYESNRRLTRRESQRLGEALGSRNQAALRAAEIEVELAETRSRLLLIEPLEQEQTEEIDALQRERQALQRQLELLAEREERLRGHARQAVELSQEVRALEDLLEEATSDLENKDESIDRLEQDLKQVSRQTGKARTKQSETLARRFRALYKTLEVDDRALHNLAELGDEGLRLKAEESIKRLAEDAENVSVRRKVGGLPAHVQVFELGFAGKGRIYYSRGKTRRFRILLVGAKNTQSADLEFLSRLPKDEFS
jgi:hypothetical protein